MVLAIACLLVVAVSTLLGHRTLSWREIGWPSDGSHSLFWDFRLPRALLGCVAGAGLALGGAAFQSLFRNPLAEPYTLGIASGASLGAAVAYLLRLDSSWLGLPATPLLALVGALLAMALVLMMARLSSGPDMTRMLLAGVCTAYLSSAGVLLAMYLSNRPIGDDIVRWTTGTLSVVGYRSTLQIAVVLVPVLLFLLFNHRALTLLSLHEHVAATRGVDVRSCIGGTFVSVGVLTAVIVASCGPIAFIGLMAPHMARALVGGGMLPLLLGSGLTGATFLVACDALARTASSAELPVGVLTNLIGAVFFLGLLVRRGPGI